ncbi:MAG TPA: quinone-dependent dihydroorotate dehydrogenase [Acetobacteraceae bacterium]|nr:quinone-dependent dihydroorotate dehydrogenase [Acetobacteraceae bacterium]
MFPRLARTMMPLLRTLDPETAHRLALAALRAGLAGRQDGADDPALAVQVLGLRFPNPIGLAAGFDKDAAAVAPLMRLGFGFVEAGTVTPLPQPGNPRPRLFRLAEDGAVINRMGFNNRGLAAYAARLKRLSARPVPLGANIGVNKTGADPERDYPALAAALAPLADYIVVNVSSPNTPGLRDLQGEARLSAILAAIRTTVPAHPPLLVKIAPDLSDDGLAAVVEVCVAQGAQGLIVSNTTLARPPGLRGAAAGEAGGLSGAPLFARSTRMLARAWLQAHGRLTLIGVGGIATGADALAKIRAGAALVQVYTAFAYAGPALLPRLKAELLAALRAQGFARVAEAVGVDAHNLAEAA